MQVDVEIKAHFPHEAFVESKDTWHTGGNLPDPCCDVRVRRNVGDQARKRSATPIEIDRTINVARMLVRKVPVVPSPLATHGTNGVPDSSV